MSASLAKADRSQPDAGDNEPGHEGWPEPGAFKSARAILACVVRTTISYALPRAGLIQAEM